MKESVFGRLRVFCVAVLVKWMRGCDGPFLFKMKISFKSDKLRKFF